MAGQGTAQKEEPQKQSEATGNTQKERVLAVTVVPSSRISFSSPALQLLQLEVARGQDVDRTAVIIEFWTVDLHPNYPCKVGSPSYGQANMDNERE